MDRELVSKTGKETAIATFIVGIVCKGDGGFGSLASSIGSVGSCGPSKSNNNGSIEAEGCLEAGTVNLGTSSFGNLVAALKVICLR